MAGVGQRFIDAGFTKPKPLLDGGKANDNEGGGVSSSCRRMDFCMP